MQANPITPLNVSVRCEVGCHISTRVAEKGLAWKVFLPFPSDPQNNPGGVFIEVELDEGGKI